MVLTIHAAFGNGHVHPTPKRPRIDTIREKKGLKRLQKEANAYFVADSWPFNRMQLSFVALKLTLLFQMWSKSHHARLTLIYDTEAFAKHQRTHNKRLNHKSLIIFFYADDNCLK